MRLVDVTDDTVTVQKSILEELRSTVPIVKYSASGAIIGTPLPPLATVAKNKFGRKFLMRLLTPDSKHLEPDEAVLFPEKVLTSKKAPEAKRREHLFYLRNTLTTVLSNHADVLARDKFGYQVIFAAVRAFCPQSLLSALCLVFTGQEITPAESSGADDHVEDAEESEAGDESEEEMEVEESGEQNDEEEEEDMSVEDESDDEAEEEPETEMDVEQTSIQEDPSAHHLLKLLCQLQFSYEKRHPPVVATTIAKKAKKKAAPELITEKPLIPIDESFWESASDDATVLNFCNDLLAKLQDENLLPAWLSCNRPSFALAELAKVPSTQRALKDALGELKAEVKAAKSSHAGGKLLVSLV